MEPVSRADFAAEIHDHVSARLAHNEQRYTAGRRRLVEVLSQAGRPVTLPEITELEPDLAPSSAYRNLDVLEQCGVVHRVAGSAEHAHFELAEPLLDHHHHLICIDCGAISDIQLDDELEALVDKHLASAARAVGFEPLRHSLDLHGRCARCNGR